MTWIAALMAKKSTGIALKILAVALVALAIVGVIYAGYRFVTNLQDDLVEANRKIVLEELRANAAEVNLTLLQGHVASTAIAITALGERDAAADTEWSGLLDAALDLNLGGFTRDTAPDFNRLHARANRMLEHASRSPLSKDRSTSGDPPSRPSPH